MSGVLGLIVLDETIVAVSLPSIAKDFGLSLSASHWVVNAYLLSFTCSVAIAGRLGDLFSRRNYFSAGAALFAVSSLLAAIALDGTMLIAARALQGIAAAVIFPTSIALITGAFAPEKRGIAFGYQTTVGGIFMAFGPLVGGLLTETLSWRMIFWVGIPIIVGIVAMLWLIWSPAYDAQRRMASGAESRIEIAGPVFLILGVLGVVTYVMQGPALGWMSPSSIGFLFIGLSMLSFFVRRERVFPKPLLDLSLLKIPEFGGGAIIFAIFQFEKIAIFVFAAQFIQKILGGSPIMSGVAVSFAILPTLITAVLIGKLTDRFGSKTTFEIGATIHGAAIILLALAATQHNYLLTFAPLVLWGASMPSIAIPVRRVQMAAVPKYKQAQASGMNLTIQMLGGSLGLAACSALLSETRNYPLVFFVIGIVTFVAVLVAQRSMQREQLER